jgi:hypothetical protein
LPNGTQICRPNRRNNGPIAIGRGIGRIVLECLDGLIEHFIGNCGGIFGYKNGFFKWLEVEQHFLMADPKWSWLDEFVNLINWDKKTKPKLVMFHHQ